jgi:2-oxoglutarate ferredoxin oxidoreductase subunit gamma
MTTNKKQANRKSPSIRKKTNFIKEIRLSGSGGQGLITAGIILAKAAVIDNYDVMQTQSYGPESRGGASRADVLISNTEFFYPEAMHFDILLALTQESCDKYASKLKDNGILIADTTYVKNITIMGPQIYEVPFTDIAIKELGTSLPTNIVALGFVVWKTKVVTQKALQQAIKESVKPAYVDLNLKAMKQGMKLAENYKDERL